MNRQISRILSHLGAEEPPGIHMEPKKQKTPTQLE